MKHVGTVIGIMMLLILFGLILWIGAAVYGMDAVFGALVMVAVILAWIYTAVWLIFK